VLNILRQQSPILFEPTFGFIKLGDLGADDIPKAGVKYFFQPHQARKS